MAEHLDPQQEPVHFTVEGELNVTEETKYHLIGQIREANDYEVIEETMPCEFYGTCVIKRTEQAVSVGYQYSEYYSWQDVYNNQGVLGGRSIVQVIDELLPLGGAN